jgi:hypothetical protein
LFWRRKGIKAHSPPILRSDGCVFIRLLAVCEVKSIFRGEMLRKRHEVQFDG